MQREFKTVTFAEKSLESESVKTLINDISVVASLNHGSYPDLMNFIKSSVQRKTIHEHASLLSEAIESGSVPSHQAAASAARLGRFFLRAFYSTISKQDSIEDLIFDLGTLGVGKEQLPAAKAFLLALQGERGWYENFRRQEDFRAGLFPSLKGIGTTVELRGVFDEEIQFGEAVESYATRVQLDETCPVLPITSVALTFDSGDPDRFCFQASPDYVRWLIEELRAALHKMKMLEERYVRDQSQK